MPIYKIQFAAQGPGGGSRDKYINTWHLNSARTELASGDGVALLNAFYDSFYKPLMENWFGNTLNAGSTFKIYRVGDTPGTPPQYTYTWPSNPLLATPDGINLPTECCACLSFEGFTDPTVERARRRGRVYLGPLNSVVLNEASGTGPQLQSAFMDDCVLKYLALNDAVADAVVDIVPQFLLGVYSPTEALWTKTSHVWMDDAFDTIRNRGRAPAGRSSTSF